MTLRVALAVLAVCSFVVPNSMWAQGAGMTSDQAEPGRTTPASVAKDSVFGYRDFTKQAVVEQKFLAVDVKAVAPFPAPVTLAAAKAEPRLKDMVLVKQPRLSVQPVTGEEWALVCRMGGVKG